MIYAQVKSGQKLHLAYEAGEGDPIDRGLILVRILREKGYLITAMKGTS
jgi:hypothetical protein